MGCYFQLLLTFIGPGVSGTFPTFEVSFTGEFCGESSTYSKEDLKKSRLSLP